MPKISSCARRELIKKLLKLGFSGPFSGGNHSYMKRGKYRQIIPNPHRTKISAEFVKEMLKQADISIDDWISA